MKRDWFGDAVNVFIALVVIGVVFALGYGLWYAMQPQRTAEGYVAEKRYSPPYDERVPMKSHETCTGTGKNRSCNTWLEPARTVHHDETFQLLIVETGCTDIYTWQYVPKDEYNRVTVGDDRIFKTIWKRCATEAK